MKGGLGNQLFQYAFARSIQQKYGYENIVLDISELDGNRDREYALDGFNIPEDCVNICVDNRYARYSRRRNPLLKIGMHFCPEFVYKTGSKNNIYIWDECEYIDIYKEIDSKRDIVINGYWQSEKYFSDIKDILRKDLEFDEHDRYEKIDVYNRIANSDSTCIHVRLGDYVNNSYYNTYGPEYYKEAIERVREKSDSKFFVFSDDIKGAKEMLSPMCSDMEFVEYEGRDTLSDFFLMSQCTNFVMANSSYSWWAQYLGTEKNIVIAPSKWTRTNECKDIYMDNWILI